MQAIFETLFDVVYLGAVITLGVLMIRGSRGAPSVSALRCNGGGAGLKKLASR